MSDKTYGSIKMADGSVFVWMAGSGDGEIYGYVEKPKGGIVSKTSGWYRTSCPTAAAETVGAVEK